MKRKIGPGLDTVGRDAAYRTSARFTSGRYVSKSGERRPVASTTSNSEMTWGDLLKFNALLAVMLGGSWAAVWSVETFWLPLGAWGAVLYMGVLLLECGFLLKCIAWCVAPYYAKETAMSLEEEYLLRCAAVSARRSAECGGAPDFPRRKRVAGLPKRSSGRFAGSNGRKTGRRDHAGDSTFLPMPNITTRRHGKD